MGVRREGKNDQIKQTSSENHKWPFWISLKKNFTIEKKNDFFIISKKSSTSFPVLGLVDIMIIFKCLVKN